MLEIIILAMIIIAIDTILMSRLDERRTGRLGKHDGPSGVYAHGSQDVETQVYVPTIKDTTMPVPMSKREAREKTETYSGKERRSTRSRYQSRQA
jgi:hypothetical protein